MHDLLSDRRQTMPYFETIRDRVRFVRENELFPLTPPAPSAVSFWDGADGDFGEINPLKVNRNKLLSANFQTLLYVYDHRGIEWSVSPLGVRRTRHVLPRRGWFHKHEYVEILFVIEGSFDQLLLGERCHFPQGAFVITDQNCEHSDYIEAVDAAVLFLQIQPNYLDELLRSYPQTDELHRFLLHALHQQKSEQSFLELSYAPGGQAGVDVTDTAIVYLLEQIVREDLERLPGYEHIRRGQLIRLLQRLCTDYSLVLRSNRREGKEKALLYELERYIRLHDADVTIYALEQQFHYHRNYFNLILQKYRGLTFKKYVQNVRLDHARQLLEETTLPVRHVALAVGYENTSYFYHLFRERFGSAPQDVRAGTGSTKGVLP